MDTLSWLKLYALTIPIFFVLDLLWLGVLARDFYQKSLAHLLSPQVNWGAAFVFYLMYIAGILIFAVRPALAGGGFPAAIFWGGLFGFFTYATYDLTNMATLPDWPIKVVIVDVIWGTILCALVAGGSYAVSRFLGMGSG